mgnify:CR=1 FL=1
MGEERSRVAERGSEETGLEEEIARLMKLYIGAKSEGLKKISVMERLLKSRFMIQLEWKETYLGCNELKSKVTNKFLEMLE